MYVCPTTPYHTTPQHTITIVIVIMLTSQASCKRNVLKSQTFLLHLILFFFCLVFEYYFPFCCCCCCFSTTTFLIGPHYFVFSLFLFLSFCLSFYRNQLTPKCVFISNYLFIYYVSMDLHF